MSESSDAIPGIPDNMESRREEKVAILTKIVESYGAPGDSDEDGSLGVLLNRALTEKRKSMFPEEFNDYEQKFRLKMAEIQVCMDELSEEDKGELFEMRMAINQVLNSLSNGNWGDFEKAKIQLNAGFHAVGGVIRILSSNRPLARQTETK